MHKMVAGSSYLFLGETLKLAYDLEKEGQHTMFWESVRKIEKKYTPQHGKSVLSVELSLRSDGSLDEAKIVHRGNSLIAKFDSNCKLIEGSCSLEHYLAAEEYSKKLKIFIKNIGVEEKVSQPPPPQEILKPMLLKTETSTPPSSKEGIGRMNITPHRKYQRILTPSQIEMRLKINAFCQDKSIDVENHPELYGKPLENLMKIIEKCDEKHIPYTPFKNFLVTDYENFNANVENFEMYGMDPAKLNYMLAYSSHPTSENLKTCKEQGKDPVRDLLISKLPMNPESFKEFLKNREPVKLRLSAEEKKKRIVEIMAKHGVKEEDITPSVKKMYPTAIESIIKVCDKHEFDWKTHQYVFCWGANVLDLNLDFCRQEGKDPEQSAIVSKLCLPNDEFKEFLKNYVPAKLFMTPQEAEKEVVKIMIGEGLEEEKIPLEIKRTSPVSARRILETCKMHNFDWKNYPSIFSQGATSLNWKFELCKYNDIAVTEIEPIHFIKSKDMFRSFIRTLVAEKGAESREPPTVQSQ